MLRRSAISGYHCQWWACCVHQRPAALCLVLCAAASPILSLLGAVPWSQLLGASASKTRQCAEDARKGLAPQRAARCSLQGLSRSSAPPLFTVAHALSRFPQPAAGQVPEWASTCGWLALSQAGYGEEQPSQAQPGSSCSLQRSSHSSTPHRRTHAEQGAFSHSWLQGRCQNGRAPVGGCWP